MRNGIWGWKKARVVKVRLRARSGYMAGNEAEELERGQTLQVLLTFKKNH